MIVNNILDLKSPPTTLFSYDTAFLDRPCRRYLPDADIRMFRMEILEDALSRYPSDYPLTPPELQALAVDWAGLRTAVSDLSAFVVNGGGYFNDLWAMPHRLPRLLSIMLPALAACEEGVPVFFTGNSYGPFGTSADLHALFFGALETAFLGCRDGFYSNTWLRSIGIDISKVVSLPDDLLFLNEQIEHLPVESDVGSDPYVVLEMYTPLRELEDYTPLVRRFAEALQERWGMRLVFLPFNVGPGGMEQGLYLADHVDNLLVVDIRDEGFLPIETANAIIRNAEFVLSTRYHAQVLAVANQVPSVSILRPVAGDRRYYYNKNVGLLKQVFDGSAFAETDFVHLTMANALETLSQDLRLCSSRQRELFGEAYTANLLRLRQMRTCYLGEHIRPGASAEKEKQTT